MTPAQVAAILVAIASAGIVGGCVGWVLHEWSVARSSARLNDAITLGTRRTYASSPDGRSADNLPPDRYATGG